MALPDLRRKTRAAFTEGPTSGSTHRVTHRNVLALHQLRSVLFGSRSLPVRRVNPPYPDQGLLDLDKQPVPIHICPCRSRTERF